MEFRDLGRTDKPLGSRRSAGDAPGLGHVSHFREGGLSTSVERRKRHRRSGGRRRERALRRRVILAWSSLLVLAVLVVLGITVAIWMRQQGARSSTAVRAPQESRPPAEVRVRSEFVSPTEAEALDLVERALAVRSPDGVADCFHPGAGGPSAVVRFLEAFEATDGRLDSLKWLGSMDANRLLTEGVVLLTLKDGTPRSRLAILTPDDGGVWKIDFDAFARTAVPPWDEIMGAKEATGLVRVFAVEDHYYNGPFRDDRRWRCFSLASPDIEATMLGYCRRGSPQDHAMRRILHPLGSVAKKDPVKRVTLRIRGVGEADDRQFEIARVVAEDWVVTNEPFDGGDP